MQNILQKVDLQENRIFILTNVKNLLKPVAFIFIALLLLFVIFFIRTDYGVPYNATRQKLGIPILPNTWKKHSDTFLGQVWYLNANSSTKRYHLRKTMEIDFFNNAQKESDLYILEDKLITIDVVYDYTTPKHWAISFFNVGKGNKTMLTRQQLTDTLSKYNLN